MKIERVFLLFVVAWSTFVSISSTFGIYFFFPMIEMIEMNDISDDVIIERLTAVKSASLTTLVYFSLRYFRNRKPLSGSKQDFFRNESGL